MHIPAALQRDLRALNDALDRPDADLPALLADLGTSARLAVGSYVGLSLVIAPAPGVAFSVFDEDADPAQARTSIFLGLAPAGVESGSMVLGVVLYAGVPGAFVDLAADALWLGSAGDVRLDAHLPAPIDAAPPTFLADESAINQALGVLIAAGATLDDARAQLGEHARDSGVSTAAAARQVLAGLEGRPAREV